MTSVGEVTGLGRRVASNCFEKNVSFMAAALAYHAFISLVPTVLLLLLILATFGAGLETRLATVAATWLPGPIGAAVATLLRRGAEGTGASVVGLLVLLWGTLKIFRGLDTAFAEIYETTDTSTLVGKFRDGAVVLVALLAAVVAMVGASVVLGGLPDLFPLGGVLTPLFLAAALVVAFYPIYYVFPDADVGLWGVLPGVVVAAVGWGLLQALFQAYLWLADPTAGRFFGGVVVIVTYLYFSALVLLVGAVLNAIYGGHTAGRAGGSEPAAGQREERHERYSVGEAAAYLSDLRSDLVTDDGRPAPEGDLEIVERSTAEDGTAEWTVTLRWDIPERELAGHRSSTDHGTSTD